MMPLHKAVRLLFGSVSSFSTLALLLAVLGIMQRRPAAAPIEVRDFLLQRIARKTSVSG